MTALTLNLDTIVQLTDDAFYALCRANPEIQLERTAKGELIVMPATGGETGNHNAKLTARLEVWAEADGSGLTFDSSTCFRLPNAADRSPDAAWILWARWEALTPLQRRRFPPIAPDFVVELRSDVECARGSTPLRNVDSDSLLAIQAKMQEYIDNGVRLGWLLDPQTQKVEIYRQGLAKEVLSSPSSLAGEDVLPGFVLNLNQIL